jgi:hypothetical protein
VNDDKPATMVAARKAHGPYHMASPLAGHQAGWVALCNGRASLQAPVLAETDEGVPQWSVMAGPYGCKRCQTMAR